MFHNSPQWYAREPNFDEAAKCGILDARGSDMGKAQTVLDYPRGITFEQVWAALQETDRIVKDVAKRQAETAQQMKETDRKMQETDRLVKENAKLIGGLGGRYGEMIECMVKPNLVKKFRELGFVFTKVYHSTSIKDEKNKILAQIDLTLEDGDKVMIVEVKSKPSIEDIKGHVERMGKVRRHADLHDDKRKYLGAVGGMVINDNERDFILKNGFYVIEPSGETFIITPPEGNAKEW